MTQSYKNEIEAILSEISAKASERKGGAWMTSQCVVGNDMEKAIYNVNRKIDFNTLKSQDDVQKLIDTINKAAEDYDGVDMEGYVAGTMKWIAQLINERVLGNGEGK